MATGAYFVVIPFSSAEDGEFVAGEPFEARTPTGALFKARVAALNSGGAVAFSRTGDSRLGEFGDAVVLGSFGATPDDLAPYLSA
ncbi:MAG: hypothetical protein BGP06_17625 [Rhizobiales bacterium 65-9]|mgnify:CR=1 FL=1|nr:hypothetical protein [Hyphomicrobiales bacterium]OJY34786.1 MAG: hypothetical protein BGP06_17625 [Rhizobiales bacterium 65-9]